MADPLNDNSDSEVESPDALDQLEEPGGLEVATMPESNELQERRRKTKNRLREMTDVQEPVEAPVGAFGDDEEEPGLMDLLREANLSSKNLRFCCSGVVLVVLLIALFFIGRSVWTYFQNGEDEPVVEDPVEEPGEEGDLDTSLMGAILVGEELAEEDPALGAGEDLGTNETASDTLTQSIVDFAKLYESMEVDVNELLATNVNRRETLELYVNELKFLVYTANQNVETLNTESENLVKRFKTLEDEKDLAEEAYFEELRDLDAYAASAALLEFEEKGQEVVRLRAEFNARQKLLSFYEAILENVDARLRDIDLNEEALIKGVKVVEIEDSDLDLIIDEDEL